MALGRKKKRSKSRRKGSKKKQNTGKAFLTACIIFAVLMLAVYFRPQMGILGETLGSFLFKIFGFLVYFVLPYGLALTLLVINKSFHGKTGQNMIFTGSLLACWGMILNIDLLSIGDFSSMASYGARLGYSGRGSGALGSVLTFAVGQLIGGLGIYFLTAALVFFFILNLFDVSFHEFIKITGKKFSALGQKISAFFSKLTKKREGQAGKGQESGEDFLQSKQASPAKDNLTSQSGSEGETRDPATIPIRDFQTPGPESPDQAGRRQGRGADFQPSSGNGQQMDMETYGLSMGEEDEEQYIPPPISLLKKSSQGSAVDADQLKKMAMVIESTLDSFGIESQVVSIQRGPAVTLFELKPQAGVKVSRITNLSNDLALALASPQVRMEAPIPGKPYVGIEVPNKKTATVSLRDILESEEFIQAKGDIPVGLGKSISGRPVITKIAQMPHLLIAGATGSGKSVCINTIITSILTRYSPKEVRMILIDPKVVELSVYNGIPHLLIPVVTDPKKASVALYKAVEEMKRRFKLFSKYSVRDIQGYREKRKIEEDMENLPYIVVIIDELSDLMMVASKDVEAHITRLAQMARACGIHLVIATQRPSVDVITGTIKANIPSRISFAVSSAVDSRTILDQSGAEKLLGRGDMLYYPASFPKPKRVQGAFISDEEVSNIASFLKEKHEAHYNEDLLQSIEEEGKAGGNRPGPGEDQDELMDDVVEFISHEETTSISGLQRRFHIGYARAGRIIDDLEVMGMVSPQDGSKPRDVLIQGNQKESSDEYSE